MAFLFFDQAISFLSIGNDLVLVSQQILLDVLDMPKNLLCQVFANLLKCSILQGLQADEYHIPVQIFISIR